MKKLLLIGAALLALGTQAQAQNTTFDKGTKVVNVGVGLGTLSTGSLSIPPLAASVDVSVKDQLFDNNSSLGVGAFTSFYSTKYDFGVNSGGYRTNYFSLGVRGSFHYQLIDKLDTYTGIMLGYHIINGSFYGEGSGLLNGYSPAASGFLWGGFLGARYHFTERLGAHLELGYGLATAQLGVSFKL